MASHGNVGRVVTARAVDGAAQRSVRCCLVSMINSKAHWFLDAITALFFLAVAIVIVVFGARTEYHDGNYPAFYLGFGVLLECIYLSLHYGVAALLCSRRKLAERISQVFGLLLMLPVGLITLILLVLLDQSIRGNVRNESEQTTSNWLFGSLILLLLVAPSFLICRNIVCSFLDRRAQHAPGANS